MIRYAGTFALAAALMTSVACDKPGVEEQQKEQKAAQDNAEQQNRAARESASAQADMNQKVAVAQTDFEKAREDYRHTKMSDLADLDAKVAKLEAKEKTATGKTKDQLDSALPTIRAQRASFAADFRALESTGASMWDATKERLDKEWDGLKSAVDNAS
jgi:septal ring factor EnvC (AmiA/AmiB activator)